MRRNTLSFEVESIREYQVGKETGEGVTVFDTTLRFYVSDERLTIRGKPWPIGTKVDFEEIKKPKARRGPRQ